MRKSLKLIMMMVMLLALAGCKNEQKPNLSNGDSEKESLISETESVEDDENIPAQFKDSFLFMGYNIFYPEGTELSSTDYGKIFEYEKCCVITEAPSVAGIMLDISNIDEIPTTCQEYVISTLEGTIRSRFDFEKTEQQVDKTTLISINGIEILQVEGVFKNTEKNTDFAYVGYYFLGGPSGNRPVYTIGIGLDKNADIQHFMSEFVRQITK